MLTYVDVCWRMQVVQVACGSAHTLVVTQAGALLSWGWGHFGQLGTGSNVNSCKPVAVVGLDTVTVYKVASGLKLLVYEALSC